MRDAARVAGEEMRRAIFVQPEWLGGVPTDRRLPEGRVLYTGCGTSFHAAQTGGAALPAWSSSWRRSRRRVRCVSGHRLPSTPLTRAPRIGMRNGSRIRLVCVNTAKPESPLGELAEEVLVATPEVERSWCHTVSYTCAVATLAALRGEDVSGLPAGVETALQQREPVGAQSATDRRRRARLADGAGGRAEAAGGRLRGGGGARDGAAPSRAPGRDRRVGAGFRHRRRGSAAEGGRCGAGAARARVRTTLVPSVHPVVDIVRFQLLTLDLAEARGVDPDKIRRDDERRDRARAAYD